MLKRSLVSICLSILFAAPVGAFSTVQYHQELDKAHESLKSGDYKSAYERVSKLANQGHPCAQCLLGVMYQKGIGTKKDPAMAQKWLKESANHGFPDAQSRLGHMYLNGYLFDKDTKLAEQWLSKAAKQGVAQAQY
ncbi:MAG TPA: tetratricopeptide repeat protein, partial [Chroococcales cyanobacterium]